MPNRFAMNLRRLRLKLNLTQEEMANKIGIKRGTYATYESEVEPTLEMLEVIAKKTKANINDLTKINATKSFTKEDREATRISVNNVINKRLNQLVIPKGALTDKKYKLSTITTVVNDDGTEPSTIESLQYQVEYLLERIINAEFENLQQKKLIAELQQSQLDKQKIIDLQEKLLIKKA